MATKHLNVVVRNIKTLVAARSVGETSDAELVERFVSHKDESAFTVLVKRHGPMVFAVGRRVLRSAQDAEDVFQATFLILARKAGTIRRPGSVASWLYGAAYRLARRAREQNAVRRRHEERAANMRHPAPRVASAWQELQEVLDEVLPGLPEKYRAPLVLCYLEGKTQEQAARQLACPFSLAGFVSAEVAGLVKGGLAMTAAVKLKVATALLIACTLLASGVVAGFGSRPAAATATAQARPTLTIQNAKQPAPQAEVPPRTDQFGDPLPHGVLARMGSGRMRHGNADHIAFSQDGKSLISGSHESVRIWDTVTGQLRRRFDTKANWASAFAVSSQGICVAGANSGDGIVMAQVVDPATGKARRHIAMKDRATVSNLAFSPDGKRLAFTHKDTVRLYDPATGQETLRIPVKGEFAREIAFSPDGKTIAIADLTDTVHIHDSGDGKIVAALKRDRDKVMDIVFSPDGRFLASIAWDNRKDGEASIWDLATGKERYRLKSPSGFLLCVAFSPDGKYMATGQFKDLVLSDMATGKEVRRFPTGAFVVAATFSPDGKTLAASTMATILHWEVATGKVLPNSGDPFITRVLDLHFSADGKRLLGDAAVGIAWDPATGREIRRFPRVPDASWLHPLSPDESLLAGADRDGTIRLWDARTGREVRTLKGYSQWVYHMLFSSDGRRLFSTSADGTIGVWDAGGGQQVRQFTGHGDRTLRLAASGDGRWLASAADVPGPRGNYEVILWNLTTGKEKSRLPLAKNSAHDLAFSPDSRLLAAIGGKGYSGVDAGQVLVWDVTTAKLRHSFAGHNDRVGSLAISPDGRTLATGVMDGSLFLWELASGRRRHQFTGHESWIYALAFSPDGRSLAASSIEAPVYVWDVAGLGKHFDDKLSKTALERCWADLAGEDAAAAFQAIRMLRAAPVQALLFLRARLRPVAKADPEQLGRLLASLDSPGFEERRKARIQLEKLADRAAGALRQALQESSSLEVRRAVGKILDGLEAGGPEAWRVTRAVECLEGMGAPAALQLLAELARGAPDARLTREAGAARDRLRTSASLEIRD